MTFGLPQPLTKATYNHPLALLQQLNGKATETKNLITFKLQKFPQTIRSSYFNRIKTFGSKNTMGFGSRMQESNNPFACCGLRGITTYTRNNLERLENNAYCLGHVRNNHN